MQFANDRVFERQYKKLPKALREKMWDRLAILAADSFHPLLNDHKLNPPYESYRCINITGDWRLVYKKLAPDMYYLRAVGTHHHLFGS